MYIQIEGNTKSKLPSFSVLKASVQICGWEVYPNKIFDKKCYKEGLSASMEFEAKSDKP